MVANDSGSTLQLLAVAAFAVHQSLSYISNVMLYREGAFFRTGRGFLQRQLHSLRVALSGLLCSSCGEETSHTPYVRLPLIFSVVYRTPAIPATRSILSIRMSVYITAASDHATRER